MSKPAAVAITAVTLCCSVLSTIGSGLTLICYIILPLDNHFRHILILNLTVADFIYSLSHAVSGIVVLATRKPLRPSPACVFQGLVDQITVQAVDCAVFAITVVTVFTITRKTLAPSATTRSRYWRGHSLLIFCSIWTMPFFTGFLALGMGWYTPAGNWCWIQSEPVYLRIMLSEIWRLLFIASEICLYIRLHIFLRKRYQSLAILQQTQLRSFVGVSSSNDKEQQVDLPTQLPEVQEPLPSIVHQKANLAASSSRVEINVAPPVESWSISRLAGVRANWGSSSSYVNSRHQYLNRILLLNAYPLAYIILWMPGLVNRLLEATGRTSKLTQLLQTSTQLVGLANALTFGWNERVVKQLRDHFAKR